jgi:hypothetical protein
MLGVGVRFDTIDANAFKLPWLGIHVVGAATAPIVGPCHFFASAQNLPQYAFFPGSISHQVVCPHAPQSHSRETVRERHLRGIRELDEDLGIFFSWLKWNRGARPAAHR